MRHPVLLVTILFALVLMSDVRVAMAADNAMRRATEQKPRQERARQQMRSALAPSTATLAGDPAAAGQSTHLPEGFPPVLQLDFDAQLSARFGLSSWRTPEGPAPFSLFPNTSAGECGGGAEDLLLVQDEHGVSDDGNTAPRALGRDWRGLKRDMAFFLGYQVVAAGILYSLPESVTKWTAEQRKTSMRRWWENVQHPHWDQDNWYLNYLGHPYFGAISYIRARERGFGAFGGFWYAALLSGLYEFGIEALFERPSYQDLILTPVGGILLGALLFEPIRERIQGKPELHWYDHLTFTVTDPMGAANSLFERALGLQADIRVQFWPPALAPQAQFNECPDRSLNWQEGYHRWSYGVGIEFIFAGRKGSARRTWQK
jgi:Domain of unknown function (DUF3943)